MAAIRSIAARSRGLPVPPAAGFEEGDVARFGFGEIVQQGHRQHPVEAHRLLQPAVGGQRHQCDEPSVPSHALAASVREPRMAQFALRALGQGQDIEQPFRRLAAASPFTPALRLLCRP
jgi:hypothetical protein